MAVEDQVLSLYAGTRDFLNDISLDKVLEFEAFLLTAYKERYSIIREKVAMTKALTPELEEDLKGLITACKKEFSNVATVSN
jgi:F-type H+/Na+-transporting ATPase subunit alpha